MCRVALLLPMQGNKTQLHEKCLFLFCKIDGRINAIRRIFNRIW